MGHALAVLPTATALLGATVLVAIAPFLKNRRNAMDIGALLVALISLATCLLLLQEVGEEPFVYWLGGWEPQEGVALGIGLVADGIGAGLAALSALLIVIALLFSWRYFEAVGHLYHVLMLVFLAAATGFSLSGDLFNIFVFFEIGAVAAFALTAYEIEETGPLQGGLNFAVTNAIGAILVLFGTALLYGRTGALNLAQIGDSLAGREADGLVLTSFVLIAAGFLVKAAIVPFHFWLADAYAVSPTPVCVLFAGVLSELGLYALARIYWTVFSGAGLSQSGLRTIFVAAGIVTAILGSVMATMQRHLRRLLAFVVVAHSGLFLIGLGLLTHDGTGGTAIYVIADGFVKASLFVCVGIVLHRRGSLEEFHLHGRGRDLPIAGITFTIGALGIAGLPPFGTYLGKAVIEESVLALGYGWMPWFFVFVSAVTGGAVLKAAGHIFLGWGPRETADPWIADEEEQDRNAEIDVEPDRTPPVMIVVAVVPLLLALFVGMAPQVAGLADLVATHFADREGYAALVLEGEVPQELTIQPTGSHGKGALLGGLSTVLAIVLALGALFPHRLPAMFDPGRSSLMDPLATGLRSVHNGHVNDYVAYLTAGVALLGGAAAALLL
jgi:multicomponent Na+:H+ antiporter subunit D